MCQKRQNPLISVCHKTPFAWNHPARFFRCHSRDGLHPDFLGFSGPRRSPGQRFPEGSLCVRLQGLVSTIAAILAREYETRDTGSGMVGRPLDLSRKVQQAVSEGWLSETDVRPPL